MQYMTQPKTRKQSFSEQIDRALANSSPYTHTDPHLHHIYCMGLLKELLLYSAADLMEVHQHLEYLANREPRRPKSVR
jgi:hypothetical protein